MNLRSGKKLPEYIPSPETKEDNGMHKAAPSIYITFKENSPIEASYANGELILMNKDEESENCLNRMILLGNKLSRIGYPPSSNGMWVSVRATQQEALQIIDGLFKAKLLTDKETSQANLILGVAALEIAKPAARKFGR